MRKTRKSAARTARKRKAPGRRGKAKCKHPVIRCERVGRPAIFAQPPIFAPRSERMLSGTVGLTCERCDERLPLGPSNDDSPAVEIEMRAAELEDTENWGPALVTTLERWGIEAHHDRCGSTEASSSTSEYAAGFLSAEIESHDVAAVRDATAWSWDISRPLAEQLAETAADDAVADALEPWSCPALSDECAIRRECTNKCGLKHVASEKRMDAWLGLFDVPPALPADGDLSRLPVLNLDAMEYELTRSAEPDCRDEDGPEVERIMAEMESRERDRLTTEEAVDYAAVSGPDVCQACGDKWLGVDDCEDA